MPRLTAVDPRTADGQAKVLLDQVQQKLGMTPDMMQTRVAGTEGDFPWVALGRTA